MFAMMLRRWRLAIPLTLAVLALAVVTGGTVDQVSAHGLKFHFFGRATALIDNSIIFSDKNCDTGFIDMNGGSLDTGHCIPLFGGNSTSGFNNTLGVIATAQFAEATVKTDNTRFEGHTISTADVEGLEIDIPLFLTVPLSTPINIPGPTMAFTLGQFLAGVAESGEGLCPDLTNPANVTAGNLFTCINFAANPSDTGDGSAGDTDAITPAVLALAASLIAPLGITGVTPAQLTGITEILEVSQVTATAEAECEQHHGQPHASARAFSNDVFNDLVIQEGSTPVDASGDPQTHVSPSGEPNQSWPVTTFLAAGLAMQLTFNEQHKFVDGDIAWIKANAMHIIVTNAQGVVLLDLIVDHVFAGIHCAKHLPTDDSIGA